MIDETVEEIQEMKTHSSSIVAMKAARALTELTEREFATVEEYVRALERNSNALRRANPSHASLHTTQLDVVDSVVEANHDSVESAKAATRRAIERVVNDVETAKSQAAEHAARLLDDGTTFLIHDYSSTVLEAVEVAARDGAHLEAYVTEARPRYLGRKTVRVLGGIDRVDPHLLVDGACGVYLEECDRVVIGMDCIVGHTLYNRVGTFPLVATAAQADVPVTVVGASAKLIENGFVFENEHRSPSEVMREPAEGFVVENPAYDATPTELLASVVTEDGVQDV